MVRRSGAKSVYFGSMEGHFVAATRRGLLSHTDWLGASSAIFITATGVFPNGTSDGCMRNYEISASDTRMGAGTLVSCQFDPRSRPWYTGAMTSAPARSKSSVALRAYTSVPYTHASHPPLLIAQPGPMSINSTQSRTRDQPMHSSARRSLEPTTMPRASEGCLEATWTWYARVCPGVVCEKT